MKDKKKKKDNTICVAETKVLICAFVFAQSKFWFSISHGTAGSNKDVNALLFIFLKYHLSTFNSSSHVETIFFQNQSFPGPASQRQFISSNCTFCHHNLISKIRKNTQNFFLTNTSEKKTMLHLTLMNQKLSHKVKPSIHINLFGLSTNVLG